MYNKELQSLNFPHIINVFFFRRCHLLFNAWLHGLMAGTFKVQSVRQQQGISNFYQKPRWFQEKLKVCQEENVTHMEKKNISKGFVYKYISNLIKNLLYIKKILCTGCFGWLNNTCTPSLRIPVPLKIYCTNCPVTQQIYQTKF